MKDDMGRSRARTRTPFRHLLPPLLAVAPALACVHAPPLPPEPSDPGVISTAWRAQPHSWARLQAIEDWLVGPGPDRQPELAVEAELLLAEGRLRFAQAESGTLEASVLNARLGAAEGGFHRVLRAPGPDLAFRVRAQRGLDAVRQLRGGTAAPAAPGVLPRSRWGARSPDLSNLTLSRGPWTRITVHHTAMPTSTLGRGTAAEVAQAIQGIQRQHMRDRGFGDIGYHFLIDPAGRVWAGRSLTYQGAHARGANNVSNIGICLLGSFQSEHPTPRALAALETLVGDLRRRNSIPRSRVFGHRDFTQTECPGRYLMAWVHRYHGGVTSASR